MFIKKYRPSDATNFFKTSQDSSVGSELDWYHRGRGFESWFMLLGCVRDESNVPNKKEYWGSIELIKLIGSPFKEEVGSLLQEGPSKNLSV